MLGESCFNDNDCQFLNICQQGTCGHRDIFPLTAYTIFIYIAAGLASSLCNVSGNSMGLFKMLILVLALNYELGEATGLSQAMVVGTALPNFVTIILKRHPQGHTSLVNYPLLEIIIPSCLLGSVLGAITETLTPKIAQLSILVLVFLYFTVIFSKKLRKLFKLPKSQQKQGQPTQPSSSQQQDPNKESLISSSQGENQETYASFQNDRIEAKKEQGQSGYFDEAKREEEEDQLFQGEVGEERRKMIEYERSHHVKDVLVSFGIFVGFELLAFIVQGKLPFYDIQQCSALFAIGLVVLTVVTAGYLHWLRRSFKTRFRKYREYRIKQDVHLDHRRSFYKMAIGALIAGFIQGTLGLGGGTCIMMILLSFNLDTTVASATSGYQILFTGAASLLEFILNGEVQIVESVWCLGVCLVIGGCATLGLFHVISKLDKIAVNKFLLGIILVLCLMSIFLTIPTGLRIYQADGWTGLTKIKFHCS